jgi:hypothetical protein
LVDEIRIIVEPWCSEDSWLKVVIRRERLESVWTIKQLDSTLVVALLPYYKAKRIKVEFEPPSKAFRLAAFVILRAKLFDLCTLLDRITAQQTPTLEIWFREPAPGIRPCYRQSFWEDRPQMSQASRADRRGARYYLGVDRPNKRALEKREIYPYFYECLMLPLIVHPLWRHAAIRFDREPGRLKTSVLSSYAGILWNGDPR